MLKPRQSSRRVTPGQRAGRRALIEALENRQLLSAALPDPTAYPLNVAAPLTGTLASGTSTPSAISPSQFTTTYGISKITLNSIVGTGAGQTIAIISANDDPDLVNSSSSSFDTSDLHIFDQEFGLADPPSFTKIEQTSNIAADTGWAEEDSLDVEWAHAIAPQAKIILYEAQSAGATQLFDWGAQSAADASGVSVVSMSFGFGEFAGENSYDDNFATPSGHTGVTFVASTGDEGAPGDYPAFSPDVVAVGGTTLSSSGSTYESETGYSGSGGGVSGYESRPSYQSTVEPHSSDRTIPDVSIDGDPNTGVDVYDSYNGGYANKWYKIGGTSFSSPVWAGLIAIADQGRSAAGLGTLNGLSQTLPKLYSISASDYHDITSGNNGEYSAGPGYDLVTGRGTPIANLLVPDLAGVPATAAGTTSTASISGTIYVDTNGDGKLDDGEAGLTGVKVYIGTGNYTSSDPSVIVGSTGTYTFSNLSTGTYEVREVVPSGETVLDPGPDEYTITVSASSKIIGENFGNATRTASVSGYAYLDKNDDGKYDTGDTALSGIQIYIDLGHTGKYVSGDPVATTNSSGYYIFTGLLPGSYRVAEIIPTGYHMTNPSSGAFDPVLDIGTALTNQDWGNLT